MKKGRRRINIGSTMLIGTVMILSTTNPSAISLGHCILGIVGAVLVFSGIRARVTEDVPQNEPTGESINIFPMPEPEKAPMNIAPEETAPAFVAPPIPEAPLAYGGDVVKHDTHTIALEHIAAPAVTVPKKSKQRFCKYCGGAIDLETKKCSGCGKQYFHIKIRMSHVVTAVIIACLIMLNIFQFFQFWELSSQDRFYDDIVEALSSDDLGAATNTFKASRSYIIVGADEEDRRFTLTAHNLDEDSITVSYSSDAATVSFDEDEWKKKVNVEVIPNHPGVTAVTFEDDKSGKSFEFLIIVTD